MRAEAILKEADECEKCGGSYIHIEQYGKEPAQVIMSGSSEGISGLIMGQMMKLAQMNGMSFLDVLRNFRRIYRLNRASIDREIATGMQDM